MQMAPYTFRWVACAFVLLLATAVSAQDLTVVLCDLQDAELGCPGEMCLCLPDSLAVTFDEGSGSIFEYDEFVEGMPIDVTTVMEVKSERITSWSFGVRHDPAALSILEVTIEGTDADPALHGGWNITTFDSVQTCGSDPTCREENRTDGGGWISAIVLSFHQPTFLPLGLRNLSRARYSLSRDVGVAGTRIDLTDRMAILDHPYVSFSVVVDGRTRLWETLTHGLVRKGPEEKARALCDPADPQRTCDQPDCLCLPDTLEITFDGDRDSVLEYSEFTEGMEFDATVVTQTETAGVQAWQYGAAHDPAALEILDVTIAGTAAEEASDGGFVVASASGVHTCGADSACEKSNRVDGGGWISAIVLDFREPVTLPLARNQLARARYRILRDVGAGGTLIRFTDRLAHRDSTPNTKLAFTLDGKPRQWMTVVDGWVRRQGCGGDLPFRRGDVGMWNDEEEYGADEVLNIIDPVRLLRVMFKEEGMSFYCDKAADANDDGTLDLADPIHILQFLFLGGPEPAAPFGEPGLDGTPDGLTCCAYP